MRTIAPGFGVLVALTALTGCSSDDPAPPAASATTADHTPSPDSTDVATPSPSPSGTSALANPAHEMPEYHEGHPVEPPSNPSWDDVDRAAALDAALQAVALFARPDVPYEQWWAELGPLMSAQAQVDYQYVDPINVPARAVTGPGVLIDETSASVAGVQVPTDVGAYTVVLSRADDGAPWLVERVTPPESAG